jgi:hypothetical protein
MRAALVALATFASSLIGFALQFGVTQQTLTDGRGMIGSVAGLVALLLALVLDLVIWTSYGVYTTQVSEALSLGPVVLQLDHLLEQLGPSAAKGRALLKLQVTSHKPSPSVLGRRKEHPLGVKLRDLARGFPKDDGFLFISLDPQTDHHRQLVETARQLSATMIQTQLLMARQLANTMPSILVFIVVGWSLLLFLAYGLSSTANVLSIIAAAMGSIAVSSALFLIFELTQPYDGMFRIPPAASIR